ncbi:unnamed protein product [Mucor fragilis]
MALLFPWLFINGKGHYSFVSKNHVIKDTNGNIIPEERGGAASATSISTTFATYFKQQLLNVDRRFSRDPAFLFWAFDVKEKSNIHSAKRHTVRTGGRDLTKHDLIDSEGNSDYSKVTIVPNNISSSYAYHRKHYLDLKAMCDNLGPPQLFLTFSCDDKAPSFQNATGLRETWLDPVLFSVHFQRKWNQFFQTIKKKWADRIGGIHDFCYVMEIQDRGSPHKHLVFWTNQSADELLQDETIVCARMPPVNSPLHKLVAKHQVHRCDLVYCQKGDSSRPCRFGFPKTENESAHFDRDDRAIYKRELTDIYINPYCPFLLAMFETNMDIQVNKGPAAVQYLAKYLTKLDDNTEFRLQVSGSRDVSIDEHMKARLVGSIEAAYNLLSLHQHEKSREVIYLPMNLPHDQARGPRTDLMEPSIPGTSKDIYKKSLVEHYENRTGYQAVQTMLLTDFVKYYYPCSTHPEKAKYREFDRQKKEEFQSDYGNNLPSTIISGDMVFRLRKTKCRFWRSRLVSAMADSETFCYQQILINMPVYGCNFSDFKDQTLRTNPDDQRVFSWRDLYMHLVQFGMLHSSIDIADDATEYTMEAINTPLSPEQQNIFNSITHQIQHLNNNMNWIHGGAGTGKSFLLRKLSHHFTNLGYYVARLAPTGVAAYNIQGETIDRFFGFTTEHNQVNLFKLNDHVKLYKKTILLIDEFSMLDNRKLESLSSALIQTTGRNMPFGGMATIFFGDVGQLLPEKKYGNVWDSRLFLQEPKYALRQNMRQQDDPNFITILNKIRRLDIEDDTDVVDFIMSRVIPPPPDCIHLFTSNEAAAYENRRQLRRIQGELCRFAAIDYPAKSNSAKTTLNLESNLSEIVYIKNDATVMLTRNLDVPRGWSNGTLCIVKTIYMDAIVLEHMQTGSRKMIHRIQEYIPNTIYTRKQFPVRPAYAATIHKVQSLTLPRVAINFTEFPYHGQLYVAMSRARSADDVFFTGIERENVEHQIRLWLNCDAIELVKAI